MAKVQTRRSISVSGRTYDRLSEFCRTNGKTMSGATEELLVAMLDGRVREAGGLAALLVPHLTQPLFPKAASDLPPPLEQTSSGYDEDTRAHRRQANSRLW